MQVRVRHVPLRQADIEVVGLRLWPVALLPRPEVHGGGEGEQETARGGMNECQRLQSVFLEDLQVWLRGISTPILFFKKKQLDP